MINFFWQTFSDVEKLFLLLCYVPLLVGFLFTVLYSNAHNKYKPLWLTMWILATHAFLALEALVWFIGSLGRSHFGHGSTDMANVNLLVDLFAYLLCSFLGYKFAARKRGYWLLVTFVFVGFGLGVFFGSWNESAKPFGEVSESVLPEQTLKNGAGFDYEISTMGSLYNKDGTRLLQIRVKGDSVYYRLIYKKCQSGLDAQYLDRIRANEDSGQWMLLDSKKTAVVKKMKKRIASYEQEFSTRMGWGRYSLFVLDDFREGRRKSLDFSNVEEACVYDANSIEKLAKELWPPRSTHDDVVSKDSLPWCDEL